MRTKLLVIMLTVLVGFCWADGPAGFTASTCGEEIVLSFPSSAEGSLLYRCSEQFSERDSATGLLPIARPVAIPAGRSTYVDRTAAANTTYYYALKTRGRWLTFPPVCSNAVELTACERPVLHVDKSAYTLTVMSKGRVLKRYPIALGQRPWRRKFEQDRASTPEGRYTIYATQPRATFHRAYDINYPLPVDRVRHRLLGSSAPIGGEIQIHGDGIEGNWTWGCIALRDSDMDELFEHMEIGRGTPVWIYGGELTLSDLLADCLPHKRLSPARLGQLQHKMGLPITCLQDVATTRKLSESAPNVGSTIPALGVHQE